MKIKKAVQGWNFQRLKTLVHIHKVRVTRVTLYTAGHLHTAVPHCSHSRAPIVHTAVPRENNEHDCVYLCCRAVCKLPGCVEGHPWVNERHSVESLFIEHVVSHCSEQQTPFFSFRFNPQNNTPYITETTPAKKPTQARLWLFYVNSYPVKLMSHG